MLHKVGLLPSGNFQQVRLRILCTITNAQMISVGSAVPSCEHAPMASNFFHASDTSTSVMRAWRCTSATPTMLRWTRRNSVSNVFSPLYVPVHKPCSISDEYHHEPIHTHRQVRLQKSAISPSLPDAQKPPAKYSIGSSSAYEKEVIEQLRRPQEIFNRSGNNR
jgi:hypothetical protein